jgi:hypothetical protein
MSEQQNPVDPTTPPATPHPGDPAKPQAPDFKPIQSQDELDRVIADRLTRAKTSAKDAAKAEFEAAQEAKRQQDEAERERQRQIDAGEFEKVKTDLIGERDTAISERDGYKTKLETAMSLISGTIEDEWKAAPESVVALYKGDPADVLAKKQFLDDHKAIIDALAGKQEETKDRFRRASGKTPVPNGDPAKAVSEEASKALSRRYQ